MERIARLAEIYPLLLRRMGRLRTLVHEGMDLTYNQYKTLLTIADRGELALGDLAQELGIAMSSTSQMVDRLVGQGVVHRQQDAGNRRRVIIRLTPAGDALVSGLQQETLAGYSRMLKRLPEKEQEELVRAFETITHILGKVT